MHQPRADVGEHARRPLPPPLDPHDHDVLARAIAEAIPAGGFPREPLARRATVERLSAELADRLSRDDEEIPS